MNVADFDYDLPACFIAQAPLDKRDASRLLRLDRQSGAITHHSFGDISDMLLPGDALVLNDTRVIPARLPAYKAETGGAVEILLLERLDGRRWRALLGGRNIKPGLTLQIGGQLSCVVRESLHRAQRIIEFSRALTSQDLADLGEMPLPPYIRAALDDGERYQTVYSQNDGSAAAPTAGLHFTRELLDELRRKGVKLARCTLHIGLDTFQPVTVERVEQHQIHSEYARLDEANAAIINQAKRAGGRVIAVGTTSARTLETAANLPDALSCGATVSAFEARTELFIKPGYRWRAVDAMITNFHLPRSTLLMMLSAFAGRENLLKAYEAAKEKGYRFYSFGDAMFVA